MDQSKAPSNYLHRTCPDSPFEHMVCSQCKKPALMEYWDYYGVPEDKLRCPHCHYLVPITRWIPGVPEVKEQQKQMCLMCNGKGEL